MQSHYLSVMFPSPKRLFSEILSPCQANWTDCMTVYLPATCDRQRQAKCAHSISACAAKSHGMHGHHLDLEHWVHAHHMLEMWSEGLNSFRARCKCKLGSLVSARHGSVTCLSIWGGLQRECGHPVLSRSAAECVSGAEEWPCSCLGGLICR